MSAFQWGEPIAHTDRKLWRARDARFGEVVAKLFDEVPNPDALVDYAERLVSVRHSNLVPVLGSSLLPCPEGQGRPRHGLLMRPVPGRVLNELLLERPFQRDEAWVLATGTIDGMAALHAADLVHGDLHGGNLLVDEHFVGRIVDVLDPFTVLRLPWVWEPRQFQLDVDHVRDLVDTLIMHTAGDARAAFKFRRATQGRATFAAVRAGLAEALG